MPLSISLALACRFYVYISSTIDLHDTVDIHISLIITHHTTFSSRSIHIRNIGIAKGNAGGCKCSPKARNFGSCCSLDLAFFDLAGSLESVGSLDLPLLDSAGFFFDSAV